MSATALVCLALAACGDTPSRLAPTPSTSPGVPTAPPGLLGQLASGGYVVFFRHAARDTGAMSTADLAIVDNGGLCAPGAELTPEGVADSVAMGAAFRRHGIRTDHVYCSPTCRTEQMATLAFGAHEARRELTWPGMWTAEEQTSLTPGLRQLLGAQPSKGTNHVLVSHGNVLVADRIGATIELDQADAAVFRPLGGESFEFVGTIRKSEWLQ